MQLAAALHFSNQHELPVYYYDPKLAKKDEAEAATHCSIHISQFAQFRLGKLTNVKGSITKDGSVVNWVCGLGCV